MILEYIKLSFQDLINNKLRSFLSLIGIVIGVAVVYAIFSIADITEYAITQQLTGGNGVVTLQFTEDTEESNTMAAQMRALMSQGGKLEYRFTSNDLEELLKIEGIQDSIGNYSARATVSFEQNEAFTSTITRYTSNYIDFYSYTLSTGYDLLEFSKSERMSLALVDTNFVSNNTEYTFEEIIGKNIKLNNRVFIIVGVIQTESSSMGMSSTILIDESAYDSIFSQGTMQTISIKVDPTYDLDIVSAQASAYLNNKYGTEDNYEVQDLSFLISQITSVTGILSTVMGIIALVSLVVAGIGVMNIMFVSVIERTREIGVKRALGASKNAIRFQFIVEACTLTFIGGMLGVALGIGIVQLALFLLNFAMPINLTYVLYAIVFSISLGIAFGYLPAQRAANLNIIQAIATE
jgi:ABC-type transport system, involved in lipoprotein release, permease component